MSGRDSIVLELDFKTRVGALDLDVELSVAAESLALVGPNGAGKSTVLLCALGILRPERGRVSLDDRILFDAAARVDVPTEERGFGYVPQQHGLFPHMTAAENVAFALACAPHGARSQKRLTRSQRRERALAVLAELEVAHVADRRPATLSGGEAQRVALARALVTEPRALLLDEPFAALDASSRQTMRTLMARELARLGRPCVIVTHDVADAAMLASRIAVMDQGRIVQIGTFGELNETPANLFVRRLLRDWNGSPIPEQKEQR